MKFFPILSAVIFTTFAIAGRTPANSEDGEQSGNTQFLYNGLGAIMEFATDGDADLDLDV